MRILSTILLILTAIGTIQGQEEMAVQSIRHEFIIEGKSFYEEMTLSYDSEGRPIKSQIISDVTGGLVMNETYTYSGNKITTEMTASYSLIDYTTTSTCVYQLNNGLITAFHQEAMAYGEIDQSDGILEYDSNNRLSKTTTSFVLSNISYTETIVYGWENGNRVSTEYYDDNIKHCTHTNVFGNQSIHNQFLQNVFGGVCQGYNAPMLMSMQICLFFNIGTPSANLISESSVVETSGGLEEYMYKQEYEEDADGNISTIRVSTNGAWNDTYYIKWQSSTNCIHSVKANDNNVWYSLNGSATTNPTKGIYIHNGKKVVLK